MSAPVLGAPPAAPAPPPASPPGPRRLGLVVPVAAGVATLLAAAPVSAVVAGTSWLAHAAGVVVLVVAIGLALRRAHPALVALAQLVGVLELLVVVGTDQWWPGPAAFAEFGALVTGAGPQIDTGTPPIPGTPEIIFLATAAIGVLATAVYAVAVSAGAPAAAGIPLLAIFAVPTALTGVLLPWWAVAAPAAGFGLLLLTRDGARRQLPAGAVMTAVAVVVALLLGSAVTAIGTGGRFTGGPGSDGSGSIGLNPFTSLRGQLIRGDKNELFQVTGLPSPQYLRALTLRDFVASTGFRASAPAPGVPLDGPLPSGAAPGTPHADVTVENLGFRDYWLPLYGNPQTISGLSGGNWAYDPDSGTAYSTRPREEDSWQEVAQLPAPTAEQLRATSSTVYGIEPGYLATDGVDPRVGALAADLTRGAATPFDKTMALLDYFNGPRSTFTYSLQTAPGAGDDALVEFLTVGRSGYCEQFATAMTVMLRTVGVPARVAVGFTAGTDDAGTRTVTSNDAHAWVEAYFPGHGWTTFDPTPLTDGRAIVPPYVQEVRDQEAGTTPQDDPAADDPRAAIDPGPGTELDQQPADQTPPDAPAPSGATGPVLLVIAAVLLLLGLLLVPTALRVLARRRRLATAAGGGPDAAAAAWAEVLAESTDRGVTVPASDTVRSAARRLVREHGLDDTAQRALRELVRAVEASWYAGEDHVAADGDDDGLVAAVQTLRAGFAAGSPLGVRDRLLPRSVLRARRGAEPVTTGS